MRLRDELEAFWTGLQAVRGEILAGALWTELGGWRELTTAALTHPGQGRGALFAELSASFVLVLAPRALHPTLPTTLAQ